MGSTEDETSTPFIISKLVAVHIRRGDYESHCRMLSNDGVLFSSWNMLGAYSTNNPKPPYGLDPDTYPIDPRFINETLPALPDTIYSPPYSTSFPHDWHGRVNPTDLSREQLFMLHCWPDVTAIFNKLRDVRNLHPGLEEVYLMTNGNPSFVNELKKLLYKDGWRNVRSNLELKLTDAAAAVSQAVDQALATWAEVFIGNGVCLLHSMGIPRSKMNNICRATVL
jgi:GDP-fucose protein O-fucosyltransferase